MKKELMYSDTTLGELLKSNDDRMNAIVCSGNTSPQEILLHWDLSTNDNYIFDVNEAGGTYQKSLANEAFLAMLRNLQFTDKLLELSELNDDLVMTITISHFTETEREIDEFPRLCKNVFVHINRAPALF